MELHREDINMMGFFKYDHEDQNQGNFRKLIRVIADFNRKL